MLNICGCLFSCFSIPGCIPLFFFFFKSEFELEQHDQSEYMCVVAFKFFFINIIKENRPKPN